MVTLNLAAEHILHGIVEARSYGAAAYLHDETGGSDRRGAFRYRRLGSYDTAGDAAEALLAAGATAVQMPGGAVVHSAAEIAEPRCAGCGWFLRAEDRRNDGTLGLLCRECDEEEGA